MHTLYLHLLQCFRTVTPAETLIASSIHLYSVTLFSSHLFLQPSSFSFFFSLTPSLFSLVVMKMDGVRCPSSPSSMPFPCPKSPPRYPDLSGKRKELAKVQVLEREIGFLEEELKYCEGLQLASRSCKEVDEFVLANPDPLIPINQKVHRSQRFWKWFCGKSCSCLSWICCFSGCSLYLGTPDCCNCCQSENKWFSHQTCCLCHRSCHFCCLGKISCPRCCKVSSISCPKCTCCFPKCTEVCHCFKCKKTCCNPCYLFY